MQTGFAFLEAGAVRSKNTTNILLKNLLDTCEYCIATGQRYSIAIRRGISYIIGGLSYWLIGYGIAYGTGSPFIGLNKFGTTGLLPDEYARWFFQFVFAATSATIISGSVAERCSFFGYFAYALAALGGFILLFGFLAFNGASQGSISSPGDGAKVSLAVTNTILSGCSAGLATLLLHRLGIFAAKGEKTHWSFLVTLNGALTGMVSICAGCNVYATWAAVIVGCGAAVVFLASKRATELTTVIDDPLDAAAVHLGGGAWGMIACGLLSKDGLMAGNPKLHRKVLWPLSILKWRCNSVIKQYPINFKRTKTNHASQGSIQEYPACAHWAWSEDGWLHVTEFHDFAGSSIVHVTGGSAALIACILLGPRIGRVDPETGKLKAIRGHSVPLAALGGFILLFGFLAFNGASQGSISSPGDGAKVSLAVTNTILSGCSAGLATLLLHRLGIFAAKGEKTHWSFLVTLNGALTGMVCFCSFKVYRVLFYCIIASSVQVSICAGCNVYATWAAVLVGCGAAVVFLAAKRATELTTVIDDPLDAAAVHLGGGAWGMIACGLLSKDGLMAGNPKILAWNAAGTLAIAVWSFVLTGLLCGIMKYTHLLRIGEEEEIKGLDVAKHEEPAYPVESWLEDQYIKHDSILPLGGASMLKGGVDYSDLFVYLWSLELNS
ncbi:unnamed protein product [Notodromas monacha]|uniref:Ammonium transporter AmtB-like domain-containing protein n=1 Tax=Notodromas monacha TaxID=399045 RepID=A0A7R9GEC4_9CRUS|nr:unnamed protein product [Notodromas monacha]CAG0919599.1 unnamed protein product [Notodromas monacha]